MLTLATLRCLRLFITVAHVRCIPALLLYLETSVVKRVWCCVVLLTLKLVKYALLFFETKCKYSHYTGAAIVRRIRIYTLLVYGTLNY